MPKVKWHDEVQVSWLYEKDVSRPNSYSKKTTLPIVTRSGVWALFTTENSSQKSYKSTPSCVEDSLPHLGWSLRRCPPDWDHTCTVDLNGMTKDETSQDVKSTSKSEGLQLQRFLRYILGNLRFFWPARSWISEGDGFLTDLWRSRTLACAFTRGPTGPMPKGVWTGHTSAILSGTFHTLLRCAKRQLNYSRWKHQGLS